MYIIVVGCGKIGYYLAKALLAEGHEVLVIERDAGRVEASDDLGSVVIRGDGCEVATLLAAGTARADMLIATTGGDEDNVVACQVAKTMFHVPRTIALVNNPKNQAIFKRLGIDETVSSTDLILEHIEHEVPTHSLVHLLSLRGYGLEIVEVRIPATSPAVGKTLRDILLPPDSLLSLVISSTGGAHVPSGDTVIQAYDWVLAVTKSEQEDALRRVLVGC